MMADKKQTVFITGVTGLVGSYLLKTFLENGHKVYALARSKDNKPAKERVVEILKFWDERVLDKIDNLAVLEGDITKADLGLDSKTIDLLRKTIDEIFHLAAITRFDATLNELKKVNIEGTRNVLELSLDWNKKGKTKKVNHFSTAYVCGDHKGVFKEKDLDVGQKFNIPYEQSKFEAERVVAEYRDKGLWIDIFRPPAVVGESTTGKTFRFKQAFYQILHALNLGMFEYFPMEKKYFINSVFVNELCNGVFIISSQSTNVSKNYHLFNPQSMPLEDIVNISSEFLGFKRPKYIAAAQFIKNKSTPAQERLLRYNLFFLNTDVIINPNISCNFLKKYSFEFSSLNKKTFLILLDYAVKAGIFKKIV